MLSGEYSRSEFGLHIMGPNRVPRLFENDQTLTSEREVSRPSTAILKTQGPFPPTTFEHDSTAVELFRHDIESGRPSSLPIVLLRHERHAVYADVEKGPEATDISPSCSSLFHQQPLPSKRWPRFFRNLRWMIFNIYERLSILVLVPNLAAMTWLLLQQDPFGNPNRLSTPVALNILASVLIRQEDIVNLLFWSLGKVPKWMPLKFRRIMAKLYHLGGIHSGCGMSAVLWFFLLNVSVARLMRNPDFREFRIWIFFIVLLLDVLLTSMVVLSLPNLRAAYHNTWEQVHRFAGWVAILLFWIYFILFSALKTFGEPTADIARVIYSSPIFYCLSITTTVLILPWLRLKKIPVRAESLSDHAIRLHFTYTNLAPCTTPKFSTHPMREWHAFAAIPAAHTMGYSIVVSKAGDWTTEIIRNPPTKLWTKGSPTRGALYMAQIFRRVLLVATGSGIAPILGLLTAPDVDCRILWSTPDPENVYNSDIVDVVRSADKDAVIWNTRKLGRPKLVEMAYDMYLRSSIEAVWIISNAAVTRKFVYGLESRGVPTFAPIFDS